MLWRPGSRPSGLTSPARATPRQTPAMHSTKPLRHSSARRSAEQHQPAETALQSPKLRKSSVKRKQVFMGNREGALKQAIIGKAVDLVSSQPSHFAGG